MKIVSIVGTRPNFIKEVLINRRLRTLGTKEILVHTGQHYDREMSDVFFEELEIPAPDYHLEVPTGSHAKQTSAILSGVEEILEAERPEVTLVYGDVTSTLAGALASAKLRIPVAHVESGIRTEERLNPEEINRRVADQVSSLLLTNTQDAAATLLGEGFLPADVVFTGDVMQDILLETVAALGLKPHRGDYHVMTIHRAENVDSYDRLAGIMGAVSRSEKCILFPVHPRTKARLHEFGLLDRLERYDNLKLLPPLGYRDFVTLLSGADKVLTDSGGVRREAYILGKPVVVLIEITWFPAIARYGWKRVAGADPEAIEESLRDFHPPPERPPIFGDGRAHEHIVDAILSRFC